MTKMLNSEITVNNIDIPLHLGAIMLMEMPFMKSAINLAVKFLQKGLKIMRDQKMGR